MKRSTHLLLIAILVISAFLTGFTYKDFEANGGLSGIIANAQMIPSRLMAAASIGLTGDDELPPVETFWNVASYVNAHYYGDEPEPDQLTYAAIRGMLGSLDDRYTRFLDPKEHQTMQEENRGDFEGIGAELDTKDGHIIIRRPIKDRPAIRAGLKSGDIILKVDDTFIQGMDITEVVGLIRGPRGTEVTLTIMREDAPEPFEVSIIREIIPFEIVVSRMEDDVAKIGYIALRQFNEQCDRQFDKALNELFADGAKALILDLRGNPGGLLESAIAIGSRIIQRGNMVIIQHKGGRRNALPVDASKFKRADRPIVVLTDRGTASAAEIVAGAVQDHKVGKVIGGESYGKGKIQTIINLQDGSAVVITTAKYLTPVTVRDVEKDKIVPDIIIVEEDDEDENGDDGERLSVSRGSIRFTPRTDESDEDDVVVRKAVQILKERLGANQASSEMTNHEKS